MPAATGVVETTSRDQPVIRAFSALCPAVLSRDAGAHGEMTRLLTAGAAIASVAASP